MTDKINSTYDQTVEFLKNNSNLGIIDPQGNLFFSELNIVFYIQGSIGIDPEGYSKSKYSFKHKRIGWGELEKSFRECYESDSEFIAVELDSVRG